METARPGSKAEARRSGPLDGKCPSPVGLWQAGKRAVCLVVSASRVSGIGASGGIFGLMGADAIWCCSAR